MIQLRIVKCTRKVFERKDNLPSWTEKEYETVIHPLCEEDKVFIETDNESLPLKIQVWPKEKKK